MYKIIKLNTQDNIAVSQMIIPKNSFINDFKITTINEIPLGHKISLEKIIKGEKILKYGQIIGIASENIQVGEHVHSHNLCFADFDRIYTSSKKNITAKKSSKISTFQGIVRKNKTTGTRNYIGIISTVNCSATVVKVIADTMNNYLIKSNKFPNIDGVVCLKHSTGCGMNTNGDGMTIFNRTIEGFKKHPNFSHVFIIGLGCECAQISMFQEQDKENNIVYLNIQDEGGTKKIIDKSCALIKNILFEANNVKRVPRPISELIVGLQCGGSDAYSGITSNPALGYASDMIIQHGGSSILAETPEIYGAEHLIINKIKDETLIKKLTEHIEWWKNYTKINGSTMDNNPTPGNKKGGITTILEKSLGAVAKGGSSIIVDVLNYSESIKNKGFNFMNSPGYDPVSVTGQVASGSNIICFTTGRGSCFGCKPTPSIKISSNTKMYNHMKEDMDINSGTIMDGLETLEDNGKIIFEKIINIASGEKTKSEINGYGDDEFNPWIVGATM